MRRVEAEQGAVGLLRHDPLDGVEIQSWPLRTRQQADQQADPHADKAVFLPIAHTYDRVVYCAKIEHLAEAATGAFV